MNSLGEISAVVCSYNAEDSIKKCLSSLRSAGVGEIILVDGNSTDNTVANASNLYDEILFDERKGLGAARNIGIQAVRLEYILNIGVDNTISSECLHAMLSALQSAEKLGVSAMTNILDTSYLGKSLQVWRKSRFYPGLRNVIGTPTLFQAEHLKDFKYDDSASFSDDSDLCDRMSKHGFKFFIANAVCDEVGSINLKSVIQRWKMYGKSDYQNFNRLKQERGRLENLLSLLYPVRKELVEPIVRLGIKDCYKSIPFLILITFIRYYFWLGESIKGTYRENT